jgi:glycosyltransferase involved in cell wall biosynthesis
MTKNKLIRITTIPLSLDKLLSGQLSYMNQFYKVIGVSSEKEYLERVGEKENIEIFNIEMTRQITPIKDLISVCKLYRFFKKQKPFIVHTHTPKAGTVGMLAAKLAGVPNRLHTIAGLPLLEATGNKRKLLNFIEKVTYSCATKIYPNSFGLNEIIINEKFCNPDKLKVLGNGSTNGIDTSFFNAEKFSQEEITSLKEQLKIQEDDFVFIFVGRLVGDKGINELIEAFGRFGEEEKRRMGDLGNEGKRFTCKLLLVGLLETELDPLLPETLKSIEENPNIISVGYQNDVPPYFAVSNALVFPSYREGFPNVVMQAGAMGLPSIVSNINGCNEIIIENQNGIIIPVKNTIAIFDAMKKMVENVAFYNQLRENSRKRIVDNYEQKVVWNAILNEYKKLEKNV